MADDLTPRLADLVTTLEKKAPYVSAFYERTSGTRVTASLVQEAIEPPDPNEGLVFTLWNGQCFYEYATNRWEWDSLGRTLSDWASTAMGKRDRSKPSTDIDPGPTLIRDFVQPLSSDPSGISLSDKRDAALARLRVAASVSPKVANVFSIQGDTTRETVFANRVKRLSQKIYRTDVILVAYVSDGKQTAQTHGGISKNAAPADVTIPDGDIRALVRDAETLLSAERLAPGVYDVVTDPEWSGIIAHECFGHGMETDLYVRERALSRHYLGKRIAPDHVSLVDDPSRIHEAGGFYFDDEGQLSAPTVVIRNGVLERGLTDFASANKLRISRSANGRRESFARKAYARMTNTFFENGAHTKEEIIGSVENGLYLRHATNGMEDPQAWGIQVEGLWAEEIRQGRLTGKVYSPVIMTGFLPDLLASISMVGNDGFISGLGLCGKGHKEWVKNTTGGPHMRLRARLA